MDGAGMGHDRRSAGLAGARIAVTIPPESWFGGHDRLLSLRESAVLETEFGCRFHHVDTTPFIVGDVAGQRAEIDALRAFRPQAALGLPNGNYPWCCRTLSGSRRINIFTDILEIPLVLPWDHGLLQFPSMVLWQLPTGPEASSEDAIQRVASRINHPLIHHIAIDSGHVAEMRRLGLLTSPNVTFMPAKTSWPYIRHGRSLAAERRFDEDVAFVGNISLNRARAVFPEGSAAGRLASQVVHARRRNPVAAPWPLLLESLERLSDDERFRERLLFDDSYFWYVAYRIVEDIANAHGRIELLKAVARPVALYGGFADPGTMDELAGRFAHLRFRGSVNYADELPSVYARTRITVDCINSGFINNSSPKPPSCFSSGGFALFEHKPDFAELFGAPGEAVMFRSFDEMNRKIDYFLTHEKERLDLSDHLREGINRDHDYQDVIQRVMEGALAG